MKKTRIMCLAICALLVMTLLCGCMNEQDTERLHNKAHLMLDALIAGDREAGWGLLNEKYCSRSSYDSFFDDVSPHLQGIGAYNLDQTGWYTGIDNGVKMYELTFAVSAGEELICYLTITEIVGEEGIAGLHVEWPEERASDNAIAPYILIIVLVVCGFVGLAFVIGIIIIIVVIVRRNKPKNNTPDVMYMNSDSGYFDNGSGSGES